MILSIISFLAVIVVLVFVHELGHFLTAKASGVKVEEFGIGFPPRIAAFKRGETEYSINAIPLGGFTKMVGEEDPTEKRSLASKKPATRLLVLSAGSLMNALFPLLLLTAAFIIPHDSISGQVSIQKVEAGSPAEAAGLVANDIILQVNGTAITNGAELSRDIQDNVGKEITLLVQHPDGTTTTISVVPRVKPPVGQGPTGIATTMINTTTYKETLPFWKAIPMGVSEYGYLFNVGILGVFRNTSQFQLAGPIGIAQMTGEVAKAGISPLFEFAALLSMTLAVTNILPLPALDGGRIVFVVIEMLRGGKRISPKTEKTIHMVGFLLLIGLVFVISYFDILRITSGTGPVP
jgi:regulator of sigma E protease